MKHKKKLKFEKINFEAAVKFMQGCGGVTLPKVCEKIVIRTKFELN